jgi:putative exosortase-associated protein (TIGR04073 family)
MKNRQQYGLILFVALLIAPLSGAYAHSHTAAEKFGRGLAGLTCGFLELPGNIVKETRNQGAMGVPVGFALGMGKFLTRELVGAYEVISAPFPYPPAYRPILQPEYPWDYFD